MSRLAITRAVSPAIAQCELVHLERRPIDLELARAQHRAYEVLLRDAGCEVRTLPANGGMPDSVFIEDTAVVLDEVAVITRPGAASRRPETGAVTAALAPYRPLVTIRAPGTMDGGDVLVVGRTIYVGESARTNRAAIDQLGAALAPHGYQVRAAAVRDCLHLKSAATLVAPDMVLCNPRWVDPATFTSVRAVEVAPGEPGAANGLLVGERVIYPENFPGTAARLGDHGIALSLVNVSELQKAEGAVTCCSLVLTT